MNEEQIKLAVQTGLRMFSPGSNVTGIDLPDATGAHCLKILLVLLNSGQLRLVPSELLERQPEAPDDDS